MDKDLLQKLIDTLEGDVEYDQATLEKYSHDASLLEIRPQVVVFPKHSKDVQALVRFVGEHKEQYPDLSITPRSGGTCMAGGSINDSIIVDFARHMNTLHEVTTEQARTQPGVYYRDFEKATLRQGVVMPTYTASKDICAIGGMFGNNCGGEKTLKYGKAENYILETKTVFADGNEYTVRPLSRKELDAKIAQNDFEGMVYRDIFELVKKNYDALQEAKPKVSKNSAGYYLWNVWDKENDIFDLNRLLVGSQGTLGVTTEITWKLVPVQQHDKMLVVFLNDLKHLGDVVTELLKFKPDSLESYDDASMKLAIKFFFDFFKQMGFWGAISLGLRFIPEAWMMLRGGVPKLILLVEFTGVSEDEVSRKAVLAQRKAEALGFETRIPRTEKGEDKYWRIRHESFNMLRKHVKGRRTAPFIDDVVVNPEHLPEFLPKLTAMLDEYKMTYTVAGHAGNGNFHIIPLLDMKKRENIKAIDELSDLVYDLVLSYGGSITAEHNDGIIRTPYLAKMFGPKIIKLFAATKDICDPLGMFNPRKKVGATKQYMLDHIRVER